MLTVAWVLYLGRTSRFSEWTRQHSRSSSIAATGFLQQELLPRRQKFLPYSYLFEPLDLVARALASGPVGLQRILPIAALLALTPKILNSVRSVSYEDWSDLARPLK